ncbi:restriction endonuclease subunit S [Paenibacillus stellifer]|uniref:restriction endonuclease subunit S n=1 Tax=Paenibacillus stellifer TaxID=169760 RepID=UPI00068D5C56|nr:restriction endonuclease subunit S [Paenibacillus stellifer]
MNSEWEEKKLEELAVNLNSKRVPLSSRERERLKKVYPYYGAQGIIDYVENYLFDGEYLLIAEDGENLKSKKQHIANIAKGKFWVNNHAHILLNNDLSDLYFLYYYINNTDISGYITGSVQPKLTKANLNMVKVLLPSLPEQRGISKILKAIDDKIELNNAINKNLEEMAQALFKRWFVDFEFSNENGEPYKSSGGEFEESELGLIPKGWRVSILEEFCNISTEGVNPHLLTDKVFEHYSIPAFDDGKLPVFELGASIKSNKYKVHRNSILVSKLNPETKRVWRPYCITEDTICSTEFMNYLPKDPETFAFCYSVFNSESFYQFLISNTTGSTNSRQRAKPKATLNYRMPVGNKSIITLFSKTVEAIFEQISGLGLQNKQLADIRDSLLPKLMSGEVRVPLNKEYPISQSSDLPLAAESNAQYSTT